MSLSSSATGGTQSGETSPRELFRTVALTGLAIVVPILISGYVLFVAARFLGRFLTPIARELPGGSILMGQILAALLIGATVVVVGVIAHFRTGQRAIDYFDGAIARLPGLGTVYQSFRRMSDVMLDSDTDHFRDVKLVAFPTEGSYALAFETARTHESIETAAGREAMHTLFVPMAPNPVMGGFVLHVTAERVTDVDMSVAEGIRATVTSGVALESGDEEGFEGPVWETPDVTPAPDLERLWAIGIDIEKLRSIDRETLRNFDTEDIEERLMRTRDRHDGDGTREES